MDDKEKSFVEKFVETVTGAVGEIAKAAVMPPAPEPEAEVKIKHVLRGEAAGTPEAVPAQGKFVAKKPSLTEVSKRVARPAKSSAKKMKTNKKSGSKPNKSTARKGANKKSGRKP